MTHLNLTVDLDNPLICTWLQLERAFEPLHMGQQAEIDRLHDVYVNSVPAPDYTVAIPGADFDERHPRPGDFFNHVINPLALAQWIKEVSIKRGFPYTDKQALNLALGIEDYGF